MAAAHPVTIYFGKGRITVTTCNDAGTGIEYMVAFVTHQKSQTIGGEDLSLVGKKLDEIKPAVIFEFTKAASAQVVIDKLIRVRDSLAVHEQGVSIGDQLMKTIKAIYPEPDSQTPDPANAACSCFEKVGDSQASPEHGHGGLAY